MHTLPLDFRYYGTAMAPAWRKKYNNSIDELLKDPANSYEVMEPVSLQAVHLYYWTYMYFSTVYYVL